jgi:hypothetical protein
VLEYFREAKLRAHAAAVRGDPQVLEGLLEVDQVTDPAPEGDLGERDLGGLAAANA